MAEHNVDLIRSGIDAFNRRDFEVALAAVHDDVRWERFLSRAEASSTFVQGKDELRAVWESQVEAVDLRFEPEDFIAAGDDKVVVPSRLAVRGSGSDIVMSAPVTWVWTLDKESLVVKVEAFDDLATAFEAVGLQP